MAAMFGAAAADLPLSLRHIDSASAKSTFRTLAFETASIRLAIESAGVMQGLNDRRDALERPHAVKNYKLKLYLLQAGQAVGGTGDRSFPDRLKRSVSHFEARILHFDGSYIRETVIPRYSVPPGHVAAGFGHACGGPFRQRGSDVRSIFWNRLYRRASSQSSFC